MPKITPYLEEVSAPGPITGLDSNLAQVQDFGQGLKNFGSDVGQMLEQNTKRQEQTETADAYSSVTDQRANMTQQIQQQEADGTLSADKIGEQVDNWASDQADSYSTPGSRDYFARQSARLKASLVKSASMGQARVAYANGKVSYQQALDNDVATVSADPSQHDAVVASNLDHINEMVQNHTISPVDAPMVKQVNQQQIAMAAIRSTAQSNPALAQKMLSESDDNNLSNILTPAQQVEMQQVVKQAQNAKMIDADRQIEFQKKQRDAQDQKIMDTHYNDIQNGNMTAQQILSLPLSWQKKNEALQIAKASANQDMATTNPAAFNAIVARIGLPANDPMAINDPGQLYKYVGAKNPNQRLSVSDTGKLRTMIDQSPEGQANMTNRKGLLDVAKAQIFETNKFVPAGLTGTKDPVADYGLQKFTQALLAKEEEFRQAGQPVSSLYQIGSPNYFGKQAINFKPTPQMRAEMQGTLTNTSQQAPKDPTDGTAPLTKTYTSTQSPDKKMPPPGLSLEQFKAWKRANGG